ncbi:MAG TPA: methyltransferase [Candidatus Paceibacterota bacterium]|jgi:protein-S-isoprenylcysteine O-methyltransferase Ste14|nr:methyltransferase [Candidatus Paceibacterota bacterium]
MEHQDNHRSLQFALARSYAIYFIFSIVGLFADNFFPIGTPTSHGQIIAVLCFAAGTILIWWAQATSGVKSSTPYFERGPYRFLRNPTQIGILILIGGYAAISGSIIFLATALVGYFISDIFFKKYEAILHAQYGDQYKQYKQSVPKVF